MSNHVPTTRQEMADNLYRRFNAYKHLNDNALWHEMADRVFEFLESPQTAATAREQGRAEALADVTEGDVDAFEHGWHGALGDWRSVVKTGINHFLASRRRPVAAAGNEEIEGSG